jgi:hypothetical protein
MAWHDPVVLELCKHHGEVDPEALIVRLCRELVDECPNDQGPTPLNVLGSIRLIRECVPGEIPVHTSCSGLLVPNDGGYNVIVNADEPEERRHFSFAHEIVHTFFREVSPGVKDPSSEEEQLCDIGAAELTMPRLRFLNRMSDEPLSFALIENLHEEFGTSFEASGRRALTLTVDMACLFVASPAKTRRQKQLDRGEAILRITSWNSSDAWPDGRTYKNLPVAEDSIIGEAFANLDERTGRGPLGIPYCSTEYDIEARAYTYQRGANADHRQVVALAKASP